MTWLNGRPRRVKRLQVPNDSKLRGISILDDRILQFFGKKLADGRWQTNVYLADLREDSEALVFAKIAEMHLDLSLIQLLPSTESSFASVEWSQSPSLVTLRTHSGDGRVLKQTSFSAPAVYGNLVADRNTVALCTSSGNPPSGSLEFYSGLQDITRGIRNDINSSSANTNFVPDQIVVWDLTHDHLHTVNIFQDPNCPMLHSADFQCISVDKIALAGAVESTYAGIDAALLKCFSIQSSNNAYARTFAQPPHTSRDLILRKLGKSGSSIPSDIFIHVHDYDRLSIFHRDLLTGQIESFPTPNLPNLHQATSHRSHHRAIKGEMHELASFSGNRVLIVTEPDPELDDDLSPVARILDFDHQRVEDIVQLDSSAREELETQLFGENARVKVVTRRFNVNAMHEEDDGEYPFPDPPNPEWNDHLRDIYLEGVARLEEERDPPALEFEEAPVDHRNNNLFGFIDTRLQLPEDLDPRSLAITSSALIHIPKQVVNQDWLIFEFDG